MLIQTPIRWTDCEQKFTNCSTFDFVITIYLSIAEYKPVLDKINVIGPQLCQLSPGEGAATIEGLVIRDNRRFKAIVDGIRHKVEQLQESKQVNILQCRT